MTYVYDNNQLPKGEIYRVKVGNKKTTLKGRNTKYHIGITQKKASR